jgi:mono/diheme cytochrome c family protein
MPTATPKRQPPTVAPTQGTSADVAAGAALWPGKPCSRCHGARAEGNIGPQLAGTARTLQYVMAKVRAGGAVMPAFTADQVTDQEITQIYAWLRSLAP